WMVNLVNFMDGIDGIAASYGAFVLAAIAVVAWTAHDGSSASSATCTSVVATVLPVAGAIAGFLAVNISRRKVFMGDVGSGTLGLLVGWALVSGVAIGALPVWSAIILPATFVADASVTLAVRVVRMQHPARAHRTHAYQRMVRSGWSHLSVTGVYLAFNVVLVLPASVLAAARPDWGAAIATAVYATLAILAFWLGAGREP
ncbi:MAG: glycosyl transferase, partial [Phycisphaerae bacterium]|nr:glycosyl transferase [Phycisphaerae bacterium]